MSIGRFGDRRFDIKIGRFGYTGIGRFEHSYTTAFPGLVQIVRYQSQTLRYSQTSIAPYHGYKGLSSLPKKPGNKRDIPDNPIYKHYISKHYMRDMFDMRDKRFERFDMKV